MFLNRKIVSFVTIVIFIIIAKSQTPQILNGFPFVDSSSSSGYHGSSPIIADFNNDGSNEILYAVYSGGGLKKVYMLKNNGIVVNNFPINIFSNLLLASAAGDVNGDGYIDIVVRATDSIYVYNYAGNLLTGFPVYFGGLSSEILFVTLYDLDDDGKLEIIVRRENRVAVINYNGIIRQGWPRFLPNNFDHIFIASVSVGDINNDNIPEIIVPFSACTGYPCQLNQINIYEPDGSFFSGWPVIEDSSYDFFATPVSIYREIQSNSSYIILNSSISRDPPFDYICRTTRYSYNGTRVNRFYSTAVINNPGGTTLGDVNADNIPEVSFGFQNSAVFLYTVSGGLFSGWPRLQTSAYFWDTPVFGKLSSGMNIVVRGSHADTMGYGYMEAFDVLGNQLPWSPLRPHGGPIAFTLGDINNDGQTDLVVITRFSLVGTKVYAWTFPGIPFNRDDFPWPMFGHDRYRTFQHGFVPPDEPIGINPIGHNIPGKFKLFQNYPNPFNPVTKIGFDVPIKSYVSLIIYDVLGREMENLISSELKPGKYEVSWNSTEFPSGVYFCNFKTANYTESIKMIIIK